MINRLCLFQSRILCYPYTCISVFLISILTQKLNDGSMDFDFKKCSKRHETDVLVIFIHLAKLNYFKDVLILSS